MAQKYELEVSDKLNRWGYDHHRYAPGLYIIEDDKLVAAAKRVVFGVEVRPLTDEEAKERETVLYEASADARGGEGFECRYKDLAERGVPGFACTMWPLGTSGTRDSHELRAHGQVFDPNDYPTPDSKTPDGLGELVADNSKEGDDGAEDAESTTSETGTDETDETIIIGTDTDRSDAEDAESADATEETGTMTTADLPTSTKKKKKRGRRSRKAKS